MKKRKKPVFLLAVFLLIAGGAIAMNTSLLSMPKTEEDFQKQAADQQAELAKTNSSHSVVAGDPAKKDTPGVAGGQNDGSLVAPKGEDDPMGTNIKPVHAVKDGDPLITAPISLPGKPKRFDRTSVQVQGQWYQKESGSNQEHPGK